MHAPLPALPPMTNATRPSCAPMDSQLNAKRGRRRPAAPRHSGHHGGELIGLADQPGLQARIRVLGRGGVVADPRLVVEALGGPHGIGRLLRDLLGECQRRRQRIVTVSRDQPSAKARSQKRCGR